MSEIYVCPLSRLEDTLELSKARNMVSLSGPDKSPPRPHQIDGVHLALEFNDITEEREGLVAPGQQDIQKLIAVCRAWDRTSPLLFQCWMGISRSTAAATIALASLDPDQDMKRLALSLREASPMATPNARMIALADHELALHGRLDAAIQAIGRGVEASQGIPFALKLPTVLQ